MNILKGKLSYLLALLAVIGAGAGYVLGLITAEQAVSMIWGGLALFGIRRAM